MPEAAEGRPAKAIILHDAEDVVHSAELRVLDCLIERFDLVQLPVVPLIDKNSRWVAGTYADEFAEAHGKELIVREALGAGLPSAGVGCAFSREAMDRLAGGGSPFDADSLPRITSSASVCARSAAVPLSSRYRKPRVGALSPPANISPARSKLQSRRRRDG